MNSKEINESINTMLSSIRALNTRLESCALTIHQVNLVKLNGEKLDRLVQICDAIEQMVGNDDPDKQNHWLVVNQSVDTLNAIKKDESSNPKDNAEDMNVSPKITNDAALGHGQISDATFMSSAVDENEKSVLSLLHQLPEAVKYLITKISKSGTDHRSNTHILKDVTEFWTELQIDWKNISLNNDELIDSVELGRGGSAALGDGTLQMQNGLGLRVAVKSVWYDEENISDVLREMVLNLVLQHHATVQLYGMTCPNKSTGYALFVKERMSCSLQEAMRSVKPFNAVKVLRDISGSIAHMHDHNVIHRDIKPSNILLTDDGLNAKLSSFGISRRQVENTLSLRSVAVGTVTYMPPEVEPLSIWKTQSSWDTWSFGIVMCEVLSSDGLFAYTYKRGQQINVVKSAHTWAKRIRNVHLREVAIWCLQASPNDRAPMKQVYLHLNGTLPVGEIPSLQRNEQEQEHLHPLQHGVGPQSLHNCDRLQAKLLSDIKESFLHIFHGILSYQNLEIDRLDSDLVLKMLNDLSPKELLRFQDSPMHSSQSHLGKSDSAQSLSESREIHYASFQYGPSKRIVEFDPTLDSSLVLTLLTWIILPCAENIKTMEQITRKAARSLNNCFLEAISGSKAEEGEHFKIFVPMGWIYWLDLSDDFVVEHGEIGDLGALVGNRKHSAKKFFVERTRKILSRH